MQVYAGKEKEAVLDMLPYLRLGYVTDPSEMQSVISSQGPVCPVSCYCPRSLLCLFKAWMFNRNWKVKIL